MGKNRYKKLLKLNKHQLSNLYASSFHPFTYKNYKSFFLGAIFRGIFYPLNRRTGTYKKQATFSTFHVSLQRYVSFFLSERKDKFYFYFMNFYYWHKYT